MRFLWFMDILDRFEWSISLSGEENDLSGPIILLNKSEFFYYLRFGLFPLFGDVQYYARFDFCRSLHKCDSAFHTMTMIGMIAPKFPEKGSKNLLNFSLHR